MNRWETFKRFMMRDLSQQPIEIQVVCLITTIALCTFSKHAFNLLWDSLPAFQLSHLDSNQVFKYAVCLMLFALIMKGKKYKKELINSIKAWGSFKLGRRTGESVFADSSRWPLKKFC